METSPSMSAEAESRLTSGAPLTERTVAAAHRSIDALAKHAYRSEQGLREAAASSVDKYSQQQEQLRSQLSSSLEKSRSYMREHPFAAAGMAFAAGIILTALCSGKRD